ncbi:MAG: hypothetical protein HOV71_12885 [Hamadaea sp.]|uniref:hypothetical protein n=1 Tax=Hamadaea sp. NPDC050747 TaxID=3155789 RepID=UPI0018039708|nr:hypothetical protein [Hamadaea sp.]NUR49022.1 hypothetical protein [Hamadaea sp.]
MSDGYVPRVNVISRLGAGVIGGVLGGVVLAAVLYFLDELQAYGRLVGQESTQNDFVVALFVCGFAGAVFGIFIGRFVTGQLIPAAGVGLVFGTVWYLVLQLIVLQIRGGSLLDMGKNGLIVLGAYVIFGAATAIMYSEFGPRRQYRRYRRRTGDYELEYVPRFRRSGSRSSSRRRRRRRDDDD